MNSRFGNAAFGVLGVELVRRDPLGARFRSDTEAQAYVIACLRACDGVSIGTLNATPPGQLAGLLYGMTDDALPRPEAARIDACLRACEGIPTAALASCGVAGGVKSLVDAVLDLPERLLHSECRLVLDAVHDLTLVPTTAQAEQTTLPLTTKR